MGISHQTREELERLQELSDKAIKKNGEQYFEIKRLRERCRIQDKLISDNADLHDEIERLQQEVDELRAGVMPSHEAVIDAQQEEIERLRVDVKAAFEEAWKRGCEIDRLRKRIKFIYESSKDDIYAENERLREMLKGSQQIRAEAILYGKEKEENKRLRAALERIVNESWNAGKGGWAQKIAREVLQEMYDEYRK